MSKGITKGEWDFILTREGVIFTVDGRKCRPSIEDLQLMTQAPKLLDTIERFISRMDCDDYEGFMSLFYQAAKYVKKVRRIADGKK